MTDGVHVRPAAEGDLEDLAEIHACAYPAPGGSEGHARSLTHNAFGGLECVRVAEKGGRIVGHAALFLFELWFGGRRVPAGGIGSVAVAPEARREGVARAMVGALGAEMAERGAALALLYPFEQRFYAQLGYAAVSPAVTLRVAIGAVAALPPLEAARGSLSTVRLQGPRLHEARALYEEVAEKTSGRIVRSEARWMKLFAREESYWMGVVSQEGRLDGYVSFSYEGRAVSREQTLVIRELTARDARAARALLLACANQRDQVADLEVSIPCGDPLAMAFEDAAGSRRVNGHDHPLGYLSAGPMVRIVDLAGALAARGYACDGELTIACTNGPSPETVRLSVRGGAAQARRTDASPDLELARPALASIIAAGLRPREAAELGLLRASPGALQTAEQMFSGPRFQCLDPF
jgi:predicted acetyltransferase